MTIVAGDPDAVNPLVGLTGFACVSLVILMSLFIARREYQPIKYRGPWLLFIVGASLTLRQLVVLLWSVFPDEMPCGTQAIYSLCFYSALAISCWRLFVLLVSYKLQEERVRVQQREDHRVTDKEWWMRHLKFAKIRNMWPVVTLAIVIPTILETAGMDPLSDEEALELKQNISSDGLLGDPEKAYNYVSFGDRCPLGHITGGIYEIIMAVYLVFVLVMASKLRTFDQDRFFINLEFRLTALWLFLFIVTDIVLLNVIVSESANYWNAYGPRNEAPWMIFVCCIMLAFPLYKSYTVNATRSSANKGGTAGSNLGSDAGSLATGGDGVTSTANRGEDPLAFEYKSLAGKMLRLLREDKFLTVFEEHAKLEFSVENILFYKDGMVLLEELRAHNKQQQSNAATFAGQIETNAAGFKKLLSKARGVYDTYIRTGSDLEVNVSDQLRTSVHDALEELEDVSPETAFKLTDSLYELELSLGKCIAEIVLLMARDTFVRFKNTPQGKRYLATRRGTVAPSKKQLKNTVSTRVKALGKGKSSGTGSNNSSSHDQTKQVRPESPKKSSQKSQKQSQKKSEKSVKLAEPSSPPEPLTPKESEPESPRESEPESPKEIEPASPRDGEQSTQPESSDAAQENPLGAANTSVDAEDGSSSDNV